MTVAELREALNRYPDDMKVLVEDGGWRSADYQLCRDLITEHDNADAQPGEHVVVIW